MFEIEWPDDLHTEDLTEWKQKNEMTYMIIKSCNKQEGGVKSNQKFRIKHWSQPQSTKPLG